jgi:acyl carrier protein
VTARQQEIRVGLAEILNEVCDISAEEVKLDRSFAGDLDVDSLSMVEVVIVAEERFGVSIPDDEMQKLRTVGDAVAYIQRAGVGV